MDQKLQATITANTDGFINAINAATKSVGNAADNWSNRIASAQNSFTTASIAATELKQRIDEAAKAGQIDSTEQSAMQTQMEQASKAAQQAITDMQAAVREIAEGASGFGTTIEQFQEIKLAATDAGVPLGDVSSAFEAMDNVMREATNTSSDASEKLKKLGVSMQHLQSMSPADRMLALQDAINKEKDATVRAINANYIFGKSYQNIAKLAQTYGKSVLDAHARGAIATRRQIDELKNLERQARTSYQTVAATSQQVANATTSEWKRFTNSIMGGNITIMEAVKKAWKIIGQVVDAALDNLFDKQRQEIELVGKNLESLRETSKAREESAKQAESLASNLLTLVTSTDNVNESQARQVEMLLKLSRGYGDLVSSIDLYTASIADIEDLNIDILQRNHEKRLKSISAELNGISAEYEEMAKLAQGPSWIMSSLGYLLEFAGFKSVKNNQNQTQRDASMRMNELAGRRTQLLQEEADEKARTPAEDARRIQKAREMDILSELDVKTLRQRLKNTSPDNAKYELMRMDVEAEAGRYKKKLGHEPLELKDYVEAKMAEIDALEKAEQEQREKPRKQASDELDTILHQSTLDKYAKMREDADRKVAEMARKIGISMDDDRIQRYRAILEQEIVAQEEAEQEKADAAKKAEEEKAEAARRAEQEKAEAARRAEQEKAEAARRAEAEKAAAARRAEIDRKLSRFGFSEETADRMGLTPAERYRAYRQDRKNARIDERINRKASTGRALSPMERKRLDEFNRLRAEKQANSPEALMQKAVNDELVAADAQRKAADLQNAAAEEMKKAADTLAGMKEGKVDKYGLPPANSKESPQEQPAVPAAPQAPEAPAAPQAPEAPAAPQAPEAPAAPQAPEAPAAPQAPEAPAAPQAPEAPQGFRRTESPVVRDNLPAYVDAPIQHFPNTNEAWVPSAVDYSATLSAILDRLTTMTKNCYTVRD